MEKQISYEDYLQLEREFKKKEKSMEERLWIDSNVGLFDDILRANYNKSVEDFSRVVIAYLAQLTNAYQGVFYIVDQDQKIVEAVASYACNVDKLQQKEFEFGEGLIGEAVLSKEKIFFDNLPAQIENDKAVSIKVKFNPKAALVIPLLFNESVYGAFELIYLKSLEEKYQLFLDRVSQNIGAMLESILNSGRLQELLNKSQEQAESLKAQEEELRQNLEEMAATREAQESAQRELFETQEKFNLATATTTEGLWDLVMPEDLVTNNDTYFWWSDNFRHMLGYESEKDFPNRLDSWSNLLHPDHKEQTLAAFNAHLMDYTGETPYNVEYQLLRKTGEYRWYRAVGNTMRDEEGKPLRVAGSLIDIQEEKDLGAIRKELVERFDLAANTTTEGLWDMTMPDDLKTDDDTYFWWSDNFRYMLGYENEEDFPNRLGSWSNLLHPDHKEQTLAAFSAHLLDFTGNTPYDVEYQLLRKTGEYRWYRAVGNTLRNEEGKPLRVAGTLIDIQEKKELDHLKENVEILAEISNEGLWSIQINGKTELNSDTTFYCSPTYQRLLGFNSSEDFPPRIENWVSRLHPDDTQFTLNNFQGFLNDPSEQEYNAEYRLKMKNEHYRWFRSKAIKKLVGNENDQIKVVGILIDINEIKK